MYSYHNTIRKRIKNGELVGYVFTDDYKNIGECLLLLFDTPPFERPVRPHKYDEYADLLSEWKKQQTKQPYPEEQDKAESRY